MELLVNNAGVTAAGDYEQVTNDHVTMKICDHVTNVTIVIMSRWWTST